MKTRNYLSPIYPGTHTATARATHAADAGVIADARSRAYLGALARSIEVMTATPAEFDACVAMRAALARAARM